MSTMQTPQDEIAAIQATLVLHAEDLERIKQQLPEIVGAVRQELEQRTAEFAAAHERIWQELVAIRERQEAQALAQAKTDDNIVRIDGEIVSIKEALAALIVRVDEMVARTDEVVARIDGVVVRLDTMSRTLTEASSRVGNLAGTRYERRVARIIIRRPSRSIGLSQVQTLHTDWGETDGALLTLLKDSNAITDDEYEDALDADIILAGQNAAGQSVYAVVEIGVTVNSTHVNRAARRARTLAKATVAECSAIVIGSEIPDTERARAMRASVVVIIVAEPVD